MKVSVLFVQGAGSGAYEADQNLATSLQRMLGGSNYDVIYPKMPNEDSPAYKPWANEIAKNLFGLRGEIVLVGHSFGGAMLLKFLSEETIKPSVASLFLIATPFVGADENWRGDAFALEPDFAGKLSGITQISLYHSRDDDIVPFAHLALYARSLPQAAVRKFRSRGHQFANDLSEVAADIAKAVRPQAKRLWGPRSPSGQAYPTN